MEEVEGPLENLKKLLFETQNLYEDLKDKFERGRDVFHEVDGAYREFHRQSQKLLMKIPTSFKLEHDYVLFENDVKGLSEKLFQLMQKALDRYDEAF